MKHFYILIAVSLALMMTISEGFPSGKGHGQHNGNETHHSGHGNGTKHHNEHENGTEHHGGNGHNKTGEHNGNGSHNKTHKLDKR